jgi:hypothetical protein
MNVFWSYIKCAVHGAPVNAGCFEILKNYGNMRSLFSKEEMSYLWEDEHNTVFSILDTTISITFWLVPALWVRSVLHFVCTPACPSVCVNLPTVDISILKTSPSYNESVTPKILVCYAVCRITRSKETQILIVYSHYNFMQLCIMVMTIYHPESVNIYCGHASQI